MGISSILDDVGADDVPAPSFFADTRLDVVERELARIRPEHDLRAYLRTAPDDPAAVAARQDVFRDLDREDLRTGLTRFVDAMSVLRRRRELTARIRDPLQAPPWILDTVIGYGEAVTELTGVLSSSDPASARLRGLGRELATVVADPDLQRTLRDALSLRARLAAVRYEVTVVADRVDVRRHDPSTARDFGVDVAAVFARFGQRVPEVGRPAPRPWLDSVEAAVLGRVAQTETVLFAELTSFCDRHRDPVPAAVARLDRELQFVLAMRDLVGAAGTSVLPSVVGSTDPFSVRGLVDLALVIGRPDTTVVANDLDLAVDERTLVITGPNQGGKTTFACALAQVHHLAALGCPVAARRAEVPLVRTVLTHFERADIPGDDVGRLEDEVRRARLLLAQVDPRTLVVLNEPFSSTTFADARTLTRTTLDTVRRSGARCVCVTFVDLDDGADGADGGCDDAVVSLVAGVDRAAESSERTFRLERQPADGHAFARTLALRHGLTFEQLTSGGAVVDR